MSEYSMLDLWWEEWQLEEVTSKKIYVSFAIYNFTNSSGSYIATL
jgi:hypothetical protein